jgi:hypothetical protein
MTTNEGPAFPRDVYETTLQQRTSRPSNPLLLVKTYEYETNRYIYYAFSLPTPSERGSDAISECSLLLERFNVSGRRLLGRDIRSFKIAYSDTDILPRHEDRGENIYLLTDASDNIIPSSYSTTDHHVLNMKESHPGSRLHHVRHFYFWIPGTNPRPNSNWGLSWIHLLSLAVIFFAFFTLSTITWVNNTTRPHPL